MWDFIEFIENSSFPTWVRETPSVLGYSTVLALHTFGMAFLVGLSGVIALRILGVIRGLPLAPMRAFFPLIVIGFWLNAATGVVLTSLAARSLLANVDFYIKLTAIVAAVVCLRRVKRHAFDVSGVPDANQVGTEGKVWAAAMLSFWIVAIVAGRLTAYTNFVRLRTAAAVLVAMAVLIAARFVVRRIAASLKAGVVGSDTPAPPAPVTSTNF
jgi:hypothetical protein